MPIKDSAFKALRQNAKKAKRNQKVKSDLEALMRKVRKSIAAKDQVKAADWLKQAIKKIDKATQKGVVKRNTAGRKKSRLTKAVNALVKK
ncbi:MAG: 30S ribosomal protein S20 [Patescibacteria group bacterium]|jgi:small subunit ribosomal protein S20